MGFPVKLPGLIIGGAPRSGTTYLAAVLDKHPGAYVAKPLIPEPKICLTPDPEGDEGYRRRYHELFRDAPADALLVEKTSYYLENEEALERLRRIVPQTTRFLFILREPVARAFSNYLWSRQNGLETLDFAVAVSLDPSERPSPLPPERSYARPFDYLPRNDYGAFAERWLAAFGRERVRFILYESISSSRDLLLEEVQNFAGLRVLPAATLDPGAINPSRSDGLTLDPQLGAALKERMRPQVERFAAATGVDVSPWGY